MRLKWNDSIPVRANGESNRLKKCVDRVLASRPPVAQVDEAVSECFEAAFNVRLNDVRLSLIKNRKPTPKYF